MIRSYRDKTPSLGKGCYIDESAVVIGDVEFGENCSVWPLTVIRGDINRIRIGDNTNIQDGSVLHVTHRGEFSPEGAELVIGNEVTIGHKVLLHGCRIGNLYLGNPVQQKRPLTEREFEYFPYVARHYVKMIEDYRE